jgi:hypothetical protein
LSNEEKTNDYENFEKGMIYMKILKKGGGCPRISPFLKNNGPWTLRGLGSIIFKEWRVTWTLIENLLNIKTYTVILGMQIIRGHSPT